MVVGQVPLHTVSAIRIHQLQNTTTLRLNSTIPRTSVTLFVYFPPFVFCFQHLCIKCIYLLCKYQRWPSSRFVLTDLRELNYLWHTALRNYNWAPDYFQNGFVECRGYRTCNVEGCHMLTDRPKNGCCKAICKGESYKINLFKIDVYCNSSNGLMQSGETTAGLATKAYHTYLHYCAFL